MLKNQIENAETRHKEELVEISKEHEEKVSLLLQQLRSKESKGTPIFCCIFHTYWQL